MKKILPILTAVLALGAGTLAAQQGATITVHEAKPGLLAQATVKSDAAQATAAQELKNAKVVSGQIEERANKLVYVYKVQPAKGKSREVVVDAKSGTVVKRTSTRTTSVSKGGATTTKTVTKTTAKPAAKK